MDNTFYKVYITKLFTAKDDTENISKDFIVDEFLFEVDEETGRSVIKELQEAQERRAYEKSIPILKKAADLYKAGKNNEAVYYILNYFKGIEEI